MPVAMLLLFFLTAAMSLKEAAHQDLQGGGRDPLCDRDVEGDAPSDSRRFKRRGQTSKGDGEE